ncbi:MULTISPECIES: DUF2971 domain-containing protein [Pseudomonadota]|uniref:DUF2971 domain-containing protein n=1 Tax=Brucella anthropi (strain ATCC 49188 / DSM 6882 / CCUG 24695 / JCM 21032 / LMG 3331 / NBRC 15819 / NCTC 12168 / Alc 37) TaxID=439375 RepID=A6WY17_BRUA4|nr:DUF2971 domain-containing protein [Brucella anthropi]ABS13871.1 hypothetical protein Oant_1152 [Brucella anthropi ATCC 49188]KAB2733274.1 DUF2971 domain-containing protein [Brucella anthropi]KAB2747482.1 DUF2971 domain-containing protein [Brucella anthropi]KAB2775743.1 DUF2971 domain-containing protein [Brucella anthropi]QQC25410.1 DUF2971 domain-containing protein [Brucella anthropi]
MPISHHPSFNRPKASTPLWRYTDLSKFVDLITSRQLWLTNAEILSSDDPYEGWPGPIRFPHRLWKKLEDVPEPLRRQIIDIYGRGEGNTEDSAFASWVMLEEQSCMYTQFGRRNYYMNCWHAALHESIAMWKIYASPGAGVAIVSNGARLESALAMTSQVLNLGAVRYEDPNVLQIGASNSFDTLMVKRVSYSYEQEVRLVYWDTEDMHNPLPEFSWNKETMRFDNIVEDNRPINPGVSLKCDIDTLIERVLISPFAPSWYREMIDRLKKQLGFEFPVFSSNLLATPPLVP